MMDDGAQSARETQKMESKRSKKYFFRRYLECDKIRL